RGWWSSGQVFGAYFKSRKGRRGAKAPASFSYYRMAFAGDRESFLMRAKSIGRTSRPASRGPRMSFCLWRVKTSPRQRTLPIRVDSFHGGGTVAEDYSGEGGCVAAQGGGDHWGGPREGERETGGGEGDEGGTGGGRELRGWGNN